MAISLNNINFYKPPGPKPASRRPLVQKGGPSAANFGAPIHPPPLQNAHDNQRVGGNSRDDAVLIPSDDESDRALDGYRSDMSLPPLDELLGAVGSDLEFGSLADTGMCLNLASLSRPVR